ncbi:MAG: glucuronate isomerase [Armatimonadetes bacterium]|nr:glucuronate isomerase [Candidatus Hippobium faecium]
MVKDLEKTIEKYLGETPIYDIHTHIYNESFGDLLLWGIDELLIYHYLLAEANRYNPLPPEKLWSLSKKEFAEYVWNECFIKHTPISESAQGLLTCLKETGCPVGKDLDEIRKFFAKFTTAEYIDLVFKLSKVKKCIMTNDPFDKKEALVWDTCYKEDPRFETALRIDTLLLKFEQVIGQMNEWGYKVSGVINPGVAEEIKRFLRDYVKKFSPVYMAASLPPTFTVPEHSFASDILTKCVLPVCEEVNIPFAMMIGVKKLVNPDLRLAGDGVGRSVNDTIEYLCANYPKNKFLLTNLAREDMHGSIVCARKFSNLHVFGCWWFCNNPVIIDDFSRMRIEMLGTSVTLQHSDARVLDQLIYKWIHFKRILKPILTEKYNTLMGTDWDLSEEDIKRDIESVLGGAFEEFLAR